MFENQLALKSLLLRESEKIRQAIAQTKDESIKNDYNTWIQLREKIARQYRMSAEDTDENSPPTALLEKQANELEQKFSMALNIDTRKSTVTSLQQIQSGLATGEYAVEMIRTDYFEKARWTDTVYYAALLVDKSMKAPVLVVLDGNALEKTAITSYRKALKARVNDEVSYGYFWEPLKKYLPAAQKIYFSPDGVYQQINLNTLKNPLTQKYLLDETDIRLVSNAGDLLQQHLVSAHKQAVIFSFPDYGNPVKASTDSTRTPGFPELKELPGTLAEADSVSQVLLENKWKVTVLTRSQASESAIKLVSRPGVLHIATHGFFLKDVKDNTRNLGMESDVLMQNPLLRSGVIMAGAASYASDPGSDPSRDDGILTAYESAGLDLSGTELVVLSACETGLGEILNGQGVYGLQRSFRVAGAGAVLMSLWKIDDHATQQLMVLFYKEWIKDPAAGKQLALRKAQQALRQQFPQPYFWGAFILVGD
jgi:CHAT domain-containing protein